MNHKLYTSDCLFSTMSNNFQKSTLLKELFISRKHVMYYLKNLNFDVSKYEQFNISEINAMNQFSTKQNVSTLDFEVYQNKTSEEVFDHMVAVKYYLKGTIKQKVLEDIVMQFYLENDKNKCSLIIITQNNINDTMTKIIKQLWKKNHEYVSLLDIQSLQFNILQHKMVPPHRKMNATEKDNLFQKYNINHDSQLPEISMFDPVAKILLLRPGQVCEIIRHDKISLRNLFYRICVV